MKPETQTNSAPPIIETIDVAVAGAGSVPETLVEGVNWRVAAGEYWVVGALPWAGKSALLRTAAGLQRPQRGRHLLFGRETMDLDQEAWLEERMRIGLVFEDGGRLFGRLTIAENVALPLCYHRNCSAHETEDWVRAILSATGLLRVAHEPPSRISRPLRQRVGLARALALDPEALLLDNPVAGADPRERSWWLDFLDRLSAGHPELRSRPVTLVVTTDDLAPWVDRGRAFAVIEQQRWRAVGGRAQLAASTEPSLRELLAAGLVQL